MQGRVASQNIPPGGSPAPPAEVGSPARVARAAQSPQATPQRRAAARAAAVAAAANSPLQRRAALPEGAGGDPGNIFDGFAYEYEDDAPADDGERACLFTAVLCTLPDAEVHMHTVRPHAVIPVLHTYHAVDQQIDALSMQMRQGPRRQAKALQKVAAGAR